MPLIGESLDFWDPRAHAHLIWEVLSFESNMGTSVANLHPGRRPLSRKPVSLETIGLSCSLRERSEYRGSLPSAPFFAIPSPVVGIFGVCAELLF